MISETSKILDGVILGRNVTVEDFCIIGARFHGYKGEQTVIGDGSIIRSHTVIYAGNTIGNSFQTGNKANIREFNVIGDNVSIGTLSVVEHHVSIGSNVRIHSGVFIPEFTVLDDGAWIGPCVVITNAKYPKSPNAKQELKGVSICRNAKVGANATLLPGVTIGAGALVGAGSLVTRDVEPETIVAGSPARYFRRIHY